MILIPRLNRRQSFQGTQFSQQRIDSAIEAVRRCSAIRQQRTLPHCSARRKDDCQAIDRKRCKLEQRKRQQTGQMKTNLLSINLNTKITDLPSVSSWLVSKRTIARIENWTLYIPTFAWILHSKFKHINRFQFKM